MAPLDFLSAGKQGADDVDDAVVVDVEVLLDFAEITFGDGGEVQHAGVVDQQVDVGRGLGQRGGRGGVGDVERKRHHAVVVEAELGGVPGGGVDLFDAAGEQAFDDGFADAAIGAGDERRWRS